MSRIVASTVLVVVALTLGAVAFCNRASAAENAAVLPNPVVDAPLESTSARQTAVVAGGCFWGVQAVFQHVKGVQRVTSGYSGGASSIAEYQVVSTGSTGHAESVQITFDPARVSYGQLLKVFFSVAHDPTQLNRQGPDSGTQYRSVIFYADVTQQRIASSYIAQLDHAGAFPRRIVTRVDALSGFYPAEEYHQDFYLKNPRNPYIVFNDLPKIRALKQLFPDYYRDPPVTAAR